MTLRKAAPLTAKEVSFREWLPVEVEAAILPRQNATEEEREKTRESFNQVLDFLRGMGYPDPVIVDCGNSYTAYYRVNLPNDNKAELLTRRFLDVLNVNFSNHSSQVNTDNEGAAVMVRLPGSCTGYSLRTPGRPARIVTMEPVPDDLGIVSERMIRRVAADRTGSNHKAEHPIYQ